MLGASGLFPWGLHLRPVWPKSPHPFHRSTLSLSTWPWVPPLTCRTWRGGGSVGPCALARMEQSLSGPLATTLLWSEAFHICGPPGWFAAVLRHSERWHFSMCTSRLLSVIEGCVKTNFTTESHQVHKGMNHQSFLIMNVCVPPRQRAAFWITMSKQHKRAARRWRVFHAPCACGDPVSEHSAVKPRRSASQWWELVLQETAYSLSLFAPNLECCSTDLPCSFFRLQACSAPHDSHHWLWQVYFC